MGQLEELREYVELFSTAPTLEKMPKRSLLDKGIAGPTGAHVIEEVHIPYNLAYIASTTGTTAFQNLAGVTYNELPGREKASSNALELAGVKRGDKLLFTYPPLVNVFSKDALVSNGVKWSFLKASSRDALILAMCEERPRVVIGESSFLNAALKDAVKMGMKDLMPSGTIFITAGTPLETELLETAYEVVKGSVHDLYGCQEFGWITLDGIELRTDISLIQTADDDYYDLIVGGLPTGDSFPITDKGHCCNAEGKIITYGRVRSRTEQETIIVQTTAGSISTVERLCRTILRIKAKIVRVSPELILNADKTVAVITSNDKPEQQFVIDGCDKTEMLDVLLQAQRDYQTQNKTDPAWNKKR